MIYVRFKDRVEIWQEGHEKGCRLRWQKDITQSIRPYVRNERLRFQVLFRIREVM